MHHYSLSSISCTKYLFLGFLLCSYGEAIVAMKESHILGMMGESSRRQKHLYKKLKKELSDLSLLDRCSGEAKKKVIDGFCREGCAPHIVHNRVLSLTQKYVYEAEGELEIKIDTYQKLETAERRGLHIAGGIGCVMAGMMGMIPLVIDAHMLDSKMLMILLSTLGGIPVCVGGGILIHVFFCNR